MSDDQEYLARLGLDYQDLDRAIDTILSKIGNLEDAIGGRLPASARKASSGLTGLVEDLNKVRNATTGNPLFTGTYSDKGTQWLKRQSQAYQRLVTDLRNAEKEYQRFLEGQATGKGGGLGLSSYSSSQLEQFSVTARASGSNGALVGDIHKLQAEQERANAARQRDESQVVNAIIKDEERLAAETLRITQQVNREVEAEVQQRARAYSAALEQMLRADEQSAAAQQARRYSGGSPVSPGRTVTTTSSTGVESTLNNVANARNSASQNTGISRSSTIFGKQQQAMQQAEEQSKAELAALREMYAEQDRVGKADASLAAAEQKKSAALAQAAKKAQEQTVALPRLRYAMYDLSNATGILAAGVLAAGTAIIKTSVDYDQLYASVERTSSLDFTNPDAQGQVRALRKDLVDLTTTLPVTFANISQIATLGNQLGIGSNDISEFTKTVAEFSATTNVSVEDSATAFGRLGQILHDNDYKGIGDDIAYLGVKSVATEKDIIDTASELAVSTQGIHYTTQETLALATSVASLGVKPEQARGTFVRAFGLIGAAVGAGGAKLNDLARISGMTSDQFRDDWNAGGESAQRAFTSFTNGLGKNTAQINGNLASIGITAVRDRQTLGLLAQNQDRVAKDQANSLKANGFLTKAYSVQAATAASQFQILQNDVLRLFDTIGSQTQGPITDLLHGLQAVVNFLDRLAQNPAQAAMFALGASVLVVVGALGLLFAGFVRFSANLVALEQLLQVNNELGGGTFAIFKAIYGGSLQAGGAIREQAAATRDLTAAQTEAAQAGEGQVAENEAIAESASAAAAAQGEQAAASGAQAAAAEGAAAGGVGKLTGALGKLGLYGAIAGLVLMAPTLLSAIDEWAKHMQGLTPDVDQLTASVDGLVKKGHEATDALGTLTKGGSAFGDFGTAGTPAGGTANPFGGPNVGAQTHSTDISAGQAAVNQITTGQSTLGKQTLAPFADVGTATAEIQAYDGALTKLLQDGNQQGFNALLAVYHDEMAKGKVSTSDADAALSSLNRALGITAGDSVDAAAGIKQTADSAQEASDNFQSALDDIFNPSISAQAVQSDLATLAQDIVTYGASVAFSGKDMEQAISDVYASSDDLGVVKGRLQDLYDQLILLGYSSTVLAPLAQSIASISNPAVKSTVDMTGFGNALDTARKKAEKQAEANQEDAKTVRQLGDYASDLGTVMSRAFDLRFGSQDALDKVTGGFNDLRDRVKQARDQIASLRADLAKLRATKAANEYFLSVATEYGDTNRQAALRGEIGQNNADIAAKQKDVAAAQDKASTSLTGNSAAAIGNRQALEGIIQTDQEYLTTLAKNGASQTVLKQKAAELKRQFIDQAVQMGYNRKDVVKLAGAFDDYSKIITKVPRNITTNVDANTDPATLALAEYNEKLDALAKRVTTTTVQQRTEVVDDAKERRRVVLENRIDALSAYLDSEAKKGNYRGGIDRQVQQLQMQLASGKYREGGYTGGLPRWQTAGIVHGDEFVLNSQGYRQFPMQMLESANHGIAPRLPIINVAGPKGGGTVSLGTTERRLLAAAAAGANTPAVVRTRDLGRAMDGAWVRAGQRGAN